MATVSLHDSRPPRKRHVPLIAGVTPYGSVTLMLAAALGYHLSTEGKLKLLEDLQAHIARVYGEIARRQRA
jgi:hypothetical protein